MTTDTRFLLALFVAALMTLMIVGLNNNRSAREPTWAVGQGQVEHSRGDLPLTVFIDRSFGGAHTESAEKAISEINREAGCTLAVPVYSATGADIHIRHEGCEKDAENLPNHPGCTWRSESQIITQVGQPGDVTMSYLIFYHELTHAFGLAHDGIYKVPARAEDALMFIPITANNAFEHSYRLGIGKLLPSMSDKDRAAMNHRYCQ